MNKIIVIILFIFFQQVEAQFQPVSYDLQGDAQVLQTNPGALYSYRWMVGMPVLTHTSVFAGNSGFAPADLFSTKNSFEYKVFKTLSQLNNTDHLVVRYRQDLLNIAFKSGKNIHFFGIYSELNHINYYPADLIRLGFEGNADKMDKVYNFDQIAAKTEWLQALYYGINRKVSEQLRLGATFKIYSGIANAQSVHNKGKFYTGQGMHNYYTHYLENVDLQAQSSGFNENAEYNYYIRKLFFNGNFGAGIDLGMTLQKNKKTIWTLSVLDLGFIRYNKDVHNYTVSGSFQYEGAQLQFPEDNFIDYWKNVKDAFKEEVKKNENEKAYTSIRPTRLYTSLKFGMNGNHKNDCAGFLNPVTEYNTYFGLMGFAQYQPVKIHWGAGVFMEKKWSKYFYSRINLSADNYTYVALGAGMVANLGPVQFSFTADNLLGFSNLGQSRKQSIQFGVNIVGFDR